MGTAALSGLDALVEHDADGVITDWNDGSEALFGWTRGEAIGMRARELFPERNRARHDASLRALLMSTRAGTKYEVTVRRRDGREFPVEFTTWTLGTGAQCRVTAFARAMTAEIRAAEAAQAFRKSGRYAAILDQIQDGCFVVDLRGHFLFVNDAFCRMFGFERAATLGGSFKRSSNPDRLDETRRVFGRVYETGRPATYEHIVTSEGRTVDFVEQSISLERDEDGHPIGFLGIVRDISARRRVELELARAKEAAESANRAKSEFLANMSHEVRTPMNGILGMTELALGTSLTPYQAECLGTIRTQAELLLRIINDILDFSKVESRKLDFDAVPFAIAEAIHEATTPLAIKSRAKGVAFSIRLADAAPKTVVGDPVRLKQVLMNLAGNAVKFTETGEVAIDVSVDGQSGNEVTLLFCVSDSGIGIAPEQHDAIFEAFQQADGSMTRRFGGTGLGLAIAASIVKLMNGRIWVDSTPGKGSRFNFTATFALTDAAPARAEAEPPRTAVAARPLDVLVAEDNLVNQRVVAGLLTRRGHRVTIVNNGREAADILEQRAFDIVLMDVQMPVMNGLEATAAIRARERETGTHARIVAMTAHAMTGDRERCVAAGMDGYLSKPVNPRALFETVEA